MNIEELKLVLETVQTMGGDAKDVAYLYVLVPAITFIAEATAWIFVVITIGRFFRYLTEKLCESTEKEEQRKQADKECWQFFGQLKVALDLDTDSHGDLYNLDLYSSDKRQILTAVSEWKQAQDAKEAGNA